MGTPSNRFTPEPAAIHTRPAPPGETARASPKNAPANLFGERFLKAHEIAASDSSGAQNFGEAQRPGEECKMAICFSPVFDGSQTCEAFIADWFDSQEFPKQSVLPAPRGEESAASLRSSASTVAAFCRWREERGQDSLALNPVVASAVAWQVLEFLRVCVPSERSSASYIQDNTGHLDSEKLLVA